MSENQVIVALLGSIGTMFVIAFVLIWVFLNIKEALIIVGAVVGIASGVVALVMLWLWLATTL